MFTFRLLLLFSVLLVLVVVDGQRVFDMMDDSKSAASRGPSAFYQRKSYLQPFYTAPSQLFWRRQ